MARCGGARESGVVQALRSIAPVPKTCQNGHQALKFSPSVPKKPLFGHGISEIEDIAADQPEARQVLVPRVAVAAHVYRLPRPLPGAQGCKMTRPNSAGSFKVFCCATVTCVALAKRKVPRGRVAVAIYAIQTSTCLSKVMYSRSKSSSKPSLLMNVASSSPSPFGRNESISICSAKSTLYWESFL